MAEPKPKTEDEAPLILGEFLPYRLSVVQEKVSALFAERYEKRFGLSIQEWRVMAVTGEVPERSTQDVIERTAMGRVKVSRAAIRLADKGLIERSVHPRDQRAHMLKLTAKGRDIYRQIVPLARALQATLMKALTGEELAQLEAILTKLDGIATELSGEAAEQ